MKLPISIDYSATTQVDLILSKKANKEEDECTEN